MAASHVVLDVECERQNIPGSEFGLEEMKPIDVIQPERFHMRFRVKAWNLAKEKIETFELEGRVDHAKISETNLRIHGLMADFETINGLRQVRQALDQQLDPDYVTIRVRKDEAEDFLGQNAKPAAHHRAEMRIAQCIGAALDKQKEMPNGARA